MIGEEKGSVAISGRSSHKMTGLFSTLRWGWGGILYGSSLLENQKLRQNTGRTAEYMQE